MKPPAGHLALVGTQLLGDSITLTYLPWWDCLLGITVPGCMATPEDLRGAGLFQRL